MMKYDSKYETEFGIYMSRELKEKLIMAAKRSKKDTNDYVVDLLKNNVSASTNYEHDNIIGSEVLKTDLDEKNKSVFIRGVFYKYKTENNTDLNQLIFVIDCIDNTVILGNVH